MDRRTTIMAVFALAALFEVSWAFRWIGPSTMELSACAESHVTVPWSFEYESPEQVERLYWFYYKDSIASFFQGKFELSPQQHLLNRLKAANSSNASIRIDSLVLADNGLYTLEVNIQDKNDVGDPITRTHKGSAYVVVVEAPKGELQVQRETSEDGSCASQGVTLSCGPFQSLGFPPASVRWTDPAGQILKSSRYENGRFYVDLPGKALPGNYTCRLACSPHVTKCIPDSSPLRRPGVLPVEREMTSREGCNDWEGGFSTEEDAPEADSAGLAQNVTELWKALTRLENQWKEIQETVQQLERRENLTDNGEYTTSYLQQEVNKVSKDIANIQNNMSEVNQAQKQCSANVRVLQQDLQDLETKANQSVQTVAERFRVEMDSLKDRLGKIKGGKPVAAEDPLTMEMRESFVVELPKNSEQGRTLFSLVVMDDGTCVAGDHEKNLLWIAEPREGNNYDTKSVTLRYGTKVNSISLLPSGKVAATVDAGYILVTDPKSSSSAQEKWLFTERTYWGSAPRSDDTLLVGSRAEGQSGPTVDLVSLNRGENVEVISTVLTSEKSSALKCPDSLSLHDNDLYISDWCTHQIIRLHLDLGEVTPMDGPLYQPNYKFYEPRMTAFDNLGNMYLATGGTVCGYQGEGHYSRGFCVVLITKEGGFRKLLEEGKDVYPYGVAVTRSGLAVTWADFTKWPHEAKIKGYEFVD